MDRYVIIEEKRLIKLTDGAPVAELNAEGLWIAPKPFETAALENAIEVPEAHLPMLTKIPGSLITAGNIGQIWNVAAFACGLGTRSFQCFLAAHVETKIAHGEDLDDAHPLPDGSVKDIFIETMAASFLVTRYFYILAGCQGFDDGLGDIFLRYYAYPLFLIGQEDKNVPPDEFGDKFFHCLSEYDRAAQDEDRLAFPHIPNQKEKPPYWHFRIAFCLANRCWLRIKGISGGSLNYDEIAKIPPLNAADAEDCVRIGREFAKEYVNMSLEFATIIPISDESRKA